MVRPERPNDTQSIGPHSQQPPHPHPSGSRRDKAEETREVRPLPWVQASMGKSRPERAKALCCSAFAPSGRYLLLRHKPRALPWADSFLALQAEFTGHQ